MQKKIWFESRQIFHNLYILFSIKRLQQIISSFYYYVNKPNMRKICLILEQFFVKTSALWHAESFEIASVDFTTTSSFLTGMTLLKNYRAQKCIVQFFDCVGIGNAKSRSFILVNIWRSHCVCFVQTSATKMVIFFISS